MGRNKIPIVKRPAQKINPTFAKRKKGLVNKAIELGILCDCQVAVIAISPREDEVIDVSYGGTVSDVYERYMNLKVQMGDSRTQHAIIQRQGDDAQPPRRSVPTFQHLLNALKHINMDHSQLCQLQQLFQQKVNQAANRNQFQYVPRAGPPQGQQNMQFSQMQQASVVAPPIQQPSHMAPPIQQPSHMAPPMQQHSGFLPPPMQQQSGFLAPKMQELDYWE